MNNLEVWEGLGFNRETGEAIAVWYKLDEDSTPTTEIEWTQNCGWFFEDVTQKGPGGGSHTIAPWNFPRKESVEKLKQMVEARGTVVTGITYESENTQYPYSHKAAQLVLDFGAKMAAGQTIRTICSSTTKEGTQNADYVIDTEIEELRRQVSEEQKHAQA